MSSGSHDVQQNSFPVNLYHPLANPLTTVRVAMVETDPSVHNLLKAWVGDIPFITALAGVQILPGVRSNVYGVHPSFDGLSVGGMRLPG